MFLRSFLDAKLHFRYEVDHWTADHRRKVLHIFEPHALGIDAEIAFASSANALIWIGPTGRTISEWHAGHIRTVSLFDSRARAGLSDPVLH